MFKKIFIIVILFISIYASRYVYYNSFNEDTKEFILNKESINKIYPNKQQIHKFGVANLMLEKEYSLFEIVEDEKVNLKISGELSFQNVTVDFVSVLNAKIIDKNGKLFFNLQKGGIETELKDYEEFLSLIKKEMKLKAEEEKRMLVEPIKERYKLNPHLRTQYNLRKLTILENEQNEKIKKASNITNKDLFDTVVDNINAHIDNNLLYTPIYDYKNKKEFLNPFMYSKDDIKINYDLNKIIKSKAFSFVGL